VIAEGNVFSYGGGRIEDGNFFISFSQYDNDVHEIYNVEFSKEEIQQILDYYMVH
jgi:hypothetical protein